MVAKSHDIQRLSIRRRHNQLRRRNIKPHNRARIEIEKEIAINRSAMLKEVYTLVEAAGKFSMLHPCMHSKSLINIESTERTHGKYCRITMQLPQFQLKLKTFQLLHRRDHFVFTLKFLM